MNSKLEQNIKKSLLPYQVHLKVTQVGVYQDTDPMIPENIQPVETAWGAFDNNCSYVLPQKNVGNDSLSKVFVKDDCPDEETPSGTVTYSVPANTYFGYNKNEANLYAWEDINLNGQDYANTNGSCVLILEKLLFTTDGSKDTSDFSIWLNQSSETTTEQVSLIVKQGSNVIKEEIIQVASPSPIIIDLIEQNVSVYIKGLSSLFTKIKELSIDGLAGSDWGINSIFPEIFPDLIKFTISNQESITNINLASNTEIEILEVHDTSLTGTLDISTMPNLRVLRASDNNLTSLSALTNNPNLEIINVNKNASLSGSLNFSNCPNITTILASQTNISSVNVVGRTNLVRLEINKCSNISQAFDFTSCPNLEVFDAELAQISNCVFDNNSKIRGFFVSHNTIPQAEIQSGLLANKATLEAVSLQVMPQLTTALNFDDFTNLHFIWAASLVNCAGISFNNLTNLTNLNISGMTNLTSLPALGANPLNAFVWVTGTSIGPSGVDALLNHISSMNIPPIQEHPEGPGCIIYGPYEGIPVGITPTSASLSAYNDLVSRGYTIIGPVPGT